MKYKQIEEWFPDTGEQLKSRSDLMHEIREMRLSGPQYLTRDERQELIERLQATIPNFNRAMFHGSGC